MNNQMIQNGNTPFTTESLYKAITIELLEEMYRGNRVSTLLSKDKILDLLTNIKTKGADYYLIHQDFDNPNNEGVNNFNQNKHILFKTMVKEIGDSIKFDVELYKFGRSINSLRKRWAIITQEGFWSSSHPMSQFNKQKSKEKTRYLDSCTLITEVKLQKNPNSAEWSVLNKEHRLTIEFEDPKKTNKKNYFFLYFESEELLEQAKEMLFAIRSKRVNSGKLELSLKAMQKLIEGSFLFYGVSKILEVKARMKKRKVILNSFKRDINENFNTIGKFGNHLLLNWAKKYKENKLQWKRDYIPKNKYIITTLGRKEKNLPTFLTLQHLQKNVNTIKEKLPKVFGKKTEKKNSIKADGDKSVSFNLVSSDVSYAKDTTPPVDPTRIKQSKSFKINKSKTQINFNQGSCLSANEIANVSNIYLNSDIKNKTEENSLIICGPKLDKTKFFKYSYSNIQNERFIEPEGVGLSINKTHSSITTGPYLTLQIFHAVYILDTKDLEFMDHMALTFDNKKQKNFTSPLEDFYFFLQIKTINQTQTIRTKLTKATKCVPDKVYVEFNIQHSFPATDEIEVGLNLIPCNSFDMNISEKDRNFFVEYLKSFELGSCVLDVNKTKGKVFEHHLKREGAMNISEENKIVLNILDEPMPSRKSITTSKFFGPELTVGGDMYSTEELDKDFFVRNYFDEKIDRKTREKLYGVRTTEDGYILLQPNRSMPEEEFVNSLITTTQLGQNDLKNILANRKYAFLPQCEKFLTWDNISHQKNFNYTAEHVDKNISQGEWVYKVKKISKDFLCNFKGVTERRRVYYHNYFTNDILSVSEMKKIRPVHQNMFHIYNFSEIDTGSLENAGNYEWRVQMKFVNKLEMDAFVIFLKDLRRRVNLNDENERRFASYPIDTSKLTRETLENLSSNLRMLHVMVDKIEFRQNVTLKDNKKLFLRIKRTSGDGTAFKGKTMLECLEEGNVFRNSLTEDLEVSKSINLIKNMKNDSISLPKAYDVKKDEFNKSHKIIKFDTGQQKLLEIEVKPKIDRVFTIEVALTSGDSSETYVTQTNLDSIIHFSPQADYLMLPLYEESTNKISGIVHLNIWASHSGETINFEDTFDKYIATLPKKPVDKYGQTVSLGAYEPNVFKRLALRVIRSEFKTDIDTLANEVANATMAPENKTKLINILKRKCIKHTTNLTSDTWKELICDQPRRRFKRVKKFEINKKRNNFYEIFTHSEWQTFFKKIFTNVKDKSIKFENIDTYTLFPSKSDITTWKQSNNNSYSEMKDLCYLGVPSEGRGVIWDRLLDINNLFQLTRTKLNLSDKVDKEYIYNFYKTNVASSFNINFSLIDNDMNFISTMEERNDELHTIKTITKAYFLWTENNITTDKFVQQGEKRFVYFFGMLKLVHRLYQVFKSDSRTFWTIVGLSQIVDLFYQSDPLLTGEMNYTKTYVMITKLIMETHLKPIFHKFTELDFPLEYFISKQIPTLFCDYFQIELFLRLMDVMIFEAALKTNEKDKYDYIRFLCTIPLTLLKLNEKKILECQTVREIDVIFDDLISKSYNNQQFVELVCSNVEKFYKVDNFMQIYLDINANTSWDGRRMKIQSRLREYFNKVEEENKKYLKSLTSGINLNNLEDELKIKLANVRNAYGESTPDTEMTTPNFTLIYQIGGIFSHTSKLRQGDYYVYVQFTSNKISPDDLTHRANRPKVVLIYDENAKEVTNNTSFEEKFTSSYPKYMNMFLYDNMNNFISSFCVEIRTLDIMRPKKISIESNDKINKTILQLGIFKYPIETIVNNEESDLFHQIFARPSYLYDLSLENEINFSDTSTKELSFYDTLGKDMTKRNEEKVELISKAMKNKFLLEELKKTFHFINEEPISTRKAITQVLTLTPKATYVPKVIFPDTNMMHIHDILDRTLINQEGKELVVEWIKNSDSSFEEILYSIVLVDEKLITIQEKLQLLFNVAKLRSSLLFPTDNITVDKLKELVYALYKRHMVYFTKEDVDRLVDYILKKESLLEYKYVIAYSSKKETLIDNIINEKNHKPMSVVAKLIKEDKLFVDIEKSFVQIKNFLRNKFHCDTIPNEVLIKIMTFLVENSKGSADTIRIEMEVDNLIKQKMFRILNNGAVEFVNPLNNFDSGNIYEKILNEEMVSLPAISSYQDHEISFEKFKDVFYALPFIPDLIRASCGFRIQKGENFIRKFDNVKVDISYPDRRLVRNFYFTEEYNSNRNSNLNTTNFHISHVVESSSSPCDLLLKIIQKLDEDGCTSITNELKFYFDSPKLMTYFVINQNKMEEKLKFYDPLYSNSHVRNSKNRIELLFKLESNDEYSRNEMGIVLKTSGYAKFNNREWRQCKIKSGPYGSSMVRFVSLTDPKYQFNMKDEKIIAEENF